MSSAPTPRPRYRRRSDGAELTTVRASGSFAMLLDARGEPVYLPLERLAALYDVLEPIG